MRRSPLPAIAIAALLVLAGCSGLPGAGETQPSPEEFPEASAVDESVVETHSEALANTSFTLTIERSENESSPTKAQNVTTIDERTRFLVDPSGPQYLVHTNVTGQTALLVNGSIYANDTATYRLSRGDDGTTVSRLDTTMPVFDDSRDQYLWAYWFGQDTGRVERGVLNATFQREGIETFDGVPVMRYEASGVEALSGTYFTSGNTSDRFEGFSATLLLDEDGVVRHFAYEFQFAPVDSGPQRIAASYTVTDVGSTDVERPAWVANATAAA
jgi:hypothetical protein